MIVLILPTFVPLFEACQYSTPHSPGLSKRSCLPRTGCISCCRCVASKAIAAAVTMTTATTTTKTRTATNHHICIFPYCVYYCFDCFYFFYVLLLGLLLRGGTGPSTIPWLVLNIKFLPPAPAPASISGSDFTYCADTKTLNPAPLNPY